MNTQTVKNVETRPKAEKVLGNWDDENFFKRRDSDMLSFVSL